MDQKYITQIKVPYSIVVEYHDGKSFTIAPQVQCYNSYGE